MCVALVSGTSRSTDVCSLYQDEKFFHWAFMCHYGYFANVLAHVSRSVTSAYCVTASFMSHIACIIEIALHIRYSFFGEKKLDAAFMKALTSSKLK